MTDNSKLINRFETAALLANCKNKILQEWEQKARQAVQAAKVQSKIALQDSLPDFIDQLVETLKSKNPSAQDGKNALDDLGGKAKAWLVEQEQARPRH